MISTNTSNSFYYFFSAVPQVMGSVLALFGVFVLFKLSEVKSQMIGICKTIIKETIDYKYKDGTSLRLNEQLENSSFFKDLTRYIERTDLVGLKRMLELITNMHFGIPIRRYNDLFNFRKSLIIWTITFSILTTFNIISCLVCLTLGNQILNYESLLKWLFILTILLSTTCFSGLIFILIKSIGEKNSSTIPN